MKYNLYIFMIFVAILTSPSIVSSAVPTNNSSSAGAGMVSDGINTWISGSSDSMIGVDDNVNSNQPKRSDGEMALFSMVTVNYDPFQNPGVIQTLQSTAIIFLFLFVIFVFGGLAYVIIHSKYPQTGEALDYAFNMEKGFDYKEYIKTSGSVIIFIIFGSLVVYVILLISKVLGEMMTITALDSVVYSPQSPTIYFVMAIAYMTLSIFIAIRLIVISVITALLWIICALWAYHMMRDVITMVFIYFVGMIFMQPILISVATIGIMTIEWLVGNLIWIQPVYILYLGLVILLIIVALVLTLGPVTVQKLFRWGVRAI